MNEIADKIDNEVLPALEMVIEGFEKCKQQLSKKHKKAQ